ncbi:MAG TPA: steroid reductase, partial [Erysipelotrichaceae bacterium]|nr:steroid reductase [Erysipelotrichaceae bacterium]
QKSEQKKKDPKKVAMEGLFKICRCPNYFGELLMWLGVFIGGLTTYRGIGQWLFAVIALIAICVIMFDGAKRLETRQS